MEILISVLIVVIGIVILIIMNFRNRKKMDEYDNFSRERENKNRKNDQETDNVDRFGHRVVSIDDIVEIDYSNNIMKMMKQEMKNIRKLFSMHTKICFLEILKGQRKNWKEHRA